MPFWYYFSVPELPSEVAHQSNDVRIKKYLAAEGDRVDVRTPIALVENDWAVMTPTANGKGVFKKAIFDPGTFVGVGGPSAIAALMAIRITGCH